jgi:hypothetical protein
MKTTKIKCDKCKKTFDGHDEYAGCAVTLECHSGNQPDVNLDLCPDCIVRLLAWLKAGK